MILYLSYDGLTDPLGQSQILPYIIGLADKGFHFHIISFEKKDNFKTHEHTILQLIQNKNIHWHPLPYHKFPPVISTLLDIMALRKKAKNLSTHHHIQIVHCRSYITALIGLWLKKKHGLKFIFDMRGFWAEERVEGYIWNTKNPIFRIIYNYFKRKEKSFFEEADTTISLTHNARSYIEDHFTLSSNSLSTKDVTKPITVIPCCADFNLFNPQQVDKEISNEIDKKFHFGENTFKLLYLGSLGTWYMLDEMLDYFYTMNISGGFTQFVILTNDTQLALEKLQNHNWTISSTDLIFNNEILKFKNNIYANSEIIISKTSRQFVPAFINYCSASIMFIKPSFSKKASSATKMGEVLAMGKPVITNSGWGDVEEIIPKHQCGSLVSSFSEKSYLKSIQDLSNSPDDPQRRISFTKEIFSLESGIEKYQSIYKNLLQPPLTKAKL